MAYTKEDGKRSIVTRETHILYIIPNLDIGGTEKHLLSLARSLRKDKYKVFVVCLQKKGVLGEELQEKGIAVYHIGQKSLYDLTVIHKLKKYITKHRIDIVHTYLFGFDLFSDIAAKLAGVPVIISSRRQIANWKKARHILVQKLANRFVDKIVANCRGVKEFASRQENLRADKLEVIYNGIDINRFSNNDDLSQQKREMRLSPEAPVVGMIANFSPAKGHEYFLRAAAQIGKALPETKFLLVGSGHLKKKLVNLAQKLGISQSVIFTGERRDIAEILSVFDVSVLSSLTEGLPNVILESMAAAKPVVATKVGGIPEMVLDGETGFLVPPKDSTALAEAVLKLLKDKNRALEMGCAGRERTREKFSLNAMIDKYEKFYQGFRENNS